MDDFEEPSAEVVARRAASRALTAERRARLSHLKGPELRTLCKKFKLKVSGKNAELQDRIAACRSRACDDYFAQQPPAHGRLTPARPSHQRSASAARPSPGKAGAASEGAAAASGGSGGGGERDALQIAAALKARGAKSAVGGAAAREAAAEQQAEAARRAHAAAAERERMLPEPKLTKKLKRQRASEE